MAKKNIMENIDNSEGMKNVLELNLNKHVTVALTDYGKQVLKEYYMELLSYKFSIRSFELLCRSFGLSRCNSLEELVEKKIHDSKL